MSLAGFRDRNEIRIFAILSVVCTFFLSFGPGRTQGARVIAHAHALLYEGRNTIDTCHWNTLDKLYYHGHYFTSGCPGMGYLAVPTLAVFDALYSLVPEKATRPLNERFRQQLEQKCRPLIAEGCMSFDPAVNKVDLLRFHAAIWFFELLIVLLMAAGAVVFYRVLLLFELPRDLACQTSLLLGLGTTLLFYARIPYSVVPNAFLLLLAFYLITLVQRQPNASAKVQAVRLLAAGLALGFGVVVHYIQIIGAGVLFLYAWHQVGSRRVCWVALGGLPMGLLIMLYQYAAFGDPFVNPFQYAIPILAVENQQEVIRIVYPTWDRLSAIVLGLRRGLFVYNPVLVLFVLLMIRGALSLRRHVALSALGLSMLAGFFLFQASTRQVDSLWGIGPRYASVVVPFLLLGVVLIKNSLERKAFYWLAWLSVLINCLMVQRDIEAQHYAFPLADAARAFLRSGPTNSFLETALPLAGVSSPRATWLVGLAAYAVLAGILYLIWRKTTTQAPLSPPGTVQGNPQLELKAERR